jgi:hypothetical protein
MEGNMSMRHTGLTNVAATSRDSTRKIMKMSSKTMKRAGCKRQGQ